MRLGSVCRDDAGALKGADAAGSSVAGELGSRAAAAAGNPIGSTASPGNALKKALARRAIAAGSGADGAVPPHCGDGVAGTGAAAAAGWGSSVDMIAVHLHVFEHAERVRRQDGG